MRSSNFSKRPDSRQNSNFDFMDNNLRRDREAKIRAQVVGLYAQEDFVVAQHLLSSVRLACEIVGKVYTEAFAQITELEFSRKVPILGMAFALGITELQIDSALLEPDELNDNITEDVEPDFRIHERLRCYNINVKPKQKPRKSIQKVPVTKAIVKPENHFFGGILITSTFSSNRAQVSGMKTQRSNQGSFNEPNPRPFLVCDPSSKVSQVEDDEDLLEVQLRNAWEREQQLRDVREQENIQKQEAVKIYQQELERRSKETQKKQITFDYEGKVVFQNAPKPDKFPMTQHQLGFGISLEKISNQAEEIVVSLKKQKTYRRQKDTQAADLNKDNTKTQAALIQEAHDLLIPAKGVVMYCDNNQKFGPSLHNEQYSMMDRESINDSLLNPSLGLKLTRKEYNMIVQGNNNVQSSLLTSTLNQGNPTNDQSILPSQSANQSKFLKNIYSQPSFMMREGSIRINAENELEGVFSQEQSILEMELTNHRQRTLQGVKSVPKLFPPTPTEQFSINMLSNREWGKKPENSYREKELDVSNQSNLPRLKTMHAENLKQVPFPKSIKSARQKYPVTIETNKKYVRIPQSIKETLAGDSKSYNLVKF